MTIEISSPNKTIIYNDTSDHFNNGLLRLLSIDRKLFDQWLIESEKSEKSNIIDKLAFGFSKIKTSYIKKNGEVDNGPNNELGTIWYDSISENPSFGIARSNDKNIAWLVRHDGKRFVRESNPPIYEETYFEGGTLNSGYQNYLEQSSWRLEKSKRQVQNMSEITGLSYGNVLDIGSGYGYFRKALDEFGFNHSGVEVSKYANEVSKNMYGFNTYQGTISENIDKLYNKFDVVMLGDIIEHIAEPELFLKDVCCVLKPGGFLIIKTPNIDCPEVEIFGPHYHSFKREHLIYFSAKSLIDCAKKSGFNLYYSTSISHLLVGFVGKKQINSWSESLNGSDLVIYFTK